MEKKKSIIDYMAQVFTLFGFTMLCMLCFVVLVGESAKESATFFILGNQGVSTEVMGQFLLLCVIIVFLQYLFEGERILKGLSERIRNGLMVFCVFLSIILFILLFGWFPIQMWQPWVLFFLCFLVCLSGSILVSVIKSKIENQKLEEGLSKLKEQWKREEEKNE